MKQLLIIVLFATLFSVSCNKAEDNISLPLCIQVKINDFSVESCEVGANVKEYIFQGKTVFVFDPGTCGADMTSEVSDFECITLGYLGGITGNTHINEESFANAVFIQTIWKK